MRQTLQGRTGSRLLRRGRQRQGKGQHRRYAPPHAECIKFLETSIQLYIATNRVSNVAKTQKRIAEIYERDGEYTLAIKNYKDAAENYSLEQNQASSYNTCMLKVVDIGVFAAAPDYGELIKVRPPPRRSWRPSPTSTCRTS